MLSPTWCLDKKDLGQRFEDTGRRQARDNPGLMPGCQTSCLQKREKNLSLLCMCVFWSAMLCADCTHPLHL